MTSGSHDRPGEGPSSRTSLGDKGFKSKIRAVNGPVGSQPGRRCQPRPTSSNVVQRRPTSEDDGYGLAVASVVGNGRGHGSLSVLS